MLHFIFVALPVLKVSVSSRRLSPFVRKWRKLEKGCGRANELKVEGQ